MANLATTPDISVRQQRAGKRNVVSMAVSIVIFIIVVALWLAISWFSITRSGGTDELWTRFRDLPLIAQGVGGLLLLPWVLAVWVAQTAWPLWSKILLNASFVAWTVIAFFPRR